MTARLHRANWRFDSSQVHFFIQKQLNLFILCCRHSNMENKKEITNDRFKELLELAYKIKSITDHADYNENVD